MFRNIFLSVLKKGLISKLQNMADTIDCEVGNFFNKSEPVIVKIGSGNINGWLN